MCMTTAKITKKKQAELEKKAFEIHWNKHSFNSSNAHIKLTKRHVRCNMPISVHFTVIQCETRQEIWLIMPAFKTPRWIRMQIVLTTSLSTLRLGSNYKGKANMKSLHPQYMPGNLPYLMYRRSLINLDTNNLNASPIAWFFFQGT